MRLYRWIKKQIRDMYRLTRLNEKGWAAMFKMISWSRSKDDKRADFYLKRSNWIHNFLRHGAMFKGDRT